MNGKGAYRNRARGDAPPANGASVTLPDIDIDGDFEQIPFGPEDDAPIDDALKERWKAKSRAKKAAQIASQALGCASEDGRLPNGSASLGSQNSDPQAAITVLDTAIAFAPDDPMLLYQRGNLQMVLGKYDLATQDYTTVLRMQVANEQYTGQR